MVDRGNCTFTAKANSAEGANASAILIINNQKGRVFFIFIFLMEGNCAIVLLSTRAWHALGIDFI